MTKATQEKYIDNLDFRYFVSREFNESSLEASVEELAEFAFGDVETAIKAYKKEKK